MTGERVDSRVREHLDDRNVFLQDISQPVTGEGHADRSAAEVEEVIAGADLLNLKNRPPNGSNSLFKLCLRLDVINARLLLRWDFHFSKCSQVQLPVGCERELIQLNESSGQHVFRQPRS